MLLRVTVHPPNQTAYTLEFFDPDLARDMMYLIASGSVTVGGVGQANEAVPASGAPVPESDEDPAAIDQSSDGADEPIVLIADPAAYQQASDYCRRINPLGDMRRVVVATHAAELYLDAEGVSATELAGIFDATGWPQPTDFVQAIRNAAREKFGWLERVGNPGYYKVTTTGRAAVLGETDTEQPAQATLMHLPPEPGQTNGVYETTTP